MTRERLETLRRVLDRRQPDLTVLMDNVHKPHNFAAVLRSCDAVGVLEAHGVWPEPRLRPPAAASGGAGRWMRVVTHPEVERAAAHLRRRGFRILAAHPAPQAIDYREVDYTRPSALLLGAELDGVSEAALACADLAVAIPMLGMARSLNVSVAAAVVLFEAQRQRLAAGLYAQRRIDDAEYRRTLFEWLHPQIANWCRRHRRDYPPLDDEGAVDPAFRARA